MTGSLRLWTDVPGVPALRCPISRRLPHRGRQETGALQGVRASTVRRDEGAVERSGTSALGVHRALRTPQEVQAFVRRAERPANPYQTIFLRKKGKFCQTSPCICRGAVLNCPQYTARPGNEFSSPYTGTLLCWQRRPWGCVGTVHDKGISGWPFFGRPCAARRCGGHDRGRHRSSRTATLPLLPANSTKGRT